MKILRMLLVVVVLVAGISSCADYSNSGDEALQSLKVQKNDGAEPSVSYNPDATIKVDVIDSEYDIAKDIIKVIDEGDGEEIQEGQNVSISYVYYTMPGFNRQNSSWDEDGDDLTIQAYKGEGGQDDIAQLLVGLKVGAVIAVAQPGFDANSQGLDTTGKNYLIQIIIVQSVRSTLGAADGTPVPESQLNPALPKVTLAADGEPSIAIPANFTPSSEVQFEMLKQGSGKVIQDANIVSFAYTAWRADGSKIQSTWDSEGRNPLTVSPSSVNEGWKQALKGATVGSQYLIVVPADIANQSSSGTDAPEDQIFVVDVLDIIG
jgi:peptidylprolyl isomerase